MERWRHYEFEGVSMDIPLQRDEATGRYLEVYPDFAADPIFTPAGNPVVFAGEDACPGGEEAAPGGCPDCGSCRYYRPAGEHTWFGVCGSERNRQALQNL